MACRSRPSTMPRPPGTPTGQPGWSKASPSAPTPADAPRPPAGGSSGSPTAGWWSAIRWSPPREPSCRCWPASRRTSNAGRSPPSAGWPRKGSRNPAPRSPGWRCCARCCAATAGPDARRRPGGRGRAGPGEPVVGDRPAPGGCRRCPGRGGRPCRPRPGPSGRARPPHQRLARRLGRPGPARPGRDRTPGLDRGRDPRRPRPRDRPGQAAERLRDELRNHVQTVLVSSASR